MIEGPRPRIVVAEDDEAVLELVRTRLELSGYAVFYARDGHAALDVIRTVQPVGVVLDLTMPRLDGFGVLSALRAQRSHHAPATLVLTARHAAEDVRRCLALGAKDFLTKPFSDRDLIARVGRLVRKPAVRLAPADAEGPAQARAWGGAVIDI